MGDIKCRVWEVESNCFDMYGKPLFTEDIVTAFLADPKNSNNIKRWQWIKHDKDVYTQEEQDSSARANNGVPMVMAGQTKVVHIHLALEFYNAVYASALQKCFPGLGIGQIQKAKSKYNQFVNMCLYQTHEKEEQQAAGKYLYPDTEVHANFNFREEFEKVKKVASKAKALRMKKSELNGIIEQIEAGEITLGWVRETYGYAFYLDHQRQFETARQEYIRRYYVPGIRYNFYVDAGGAEHGGRVGKTQLCKMLACSFFPDLAESECYYMVGSVKAGLQQYKEQPVVIWNDMRAVDMVTKFGRPELLNFLDDHPGKVSHDIKYGDVVLVNKFNIINGIESYEDFLKGLAGTYTDKSGVEHKSEDDSQVFGRFPFIIHVSTDWLDFLINSGWYRGTGVYKEYEQVCRVTGNIGNIMRGYDGSALHALSEALTIPMKQKVEEMDNRYLNSKIVDVDCIRDIDMPRVLTPEQAEQQNIICYKQYIKQCGDDRELLCNLLGVYTNGFPCGYTHAKSILDVFDEQANYNPGRYTYEQWKMNGYPKDDITNLRRQKDAVIYERKTDDVIDDVFVFDSMADDILDFDDIPFDEVKRIREASILEMKKVIDDIVNEQQVKEKLFEAIDKIDILDEDKK